MSEDVYRKLADRLDAIPNGFPSTDSGVELRLLAKLFAEDEARLGVMMRLGYESPQTIAARVGVDPDEALRALDAMSRKGLVRMRKGSAGPAFGLMPFAVGIYEEQLPHMDKEFAGLFEQYYQETRGGGMTHEAPALHRVVPVDQAIPFDLEILPYERASEFIRTAKSWGVRQCICRVQQRLVGRGCDYPVENCLMFAPVEGAFDDSEATRPISKEESLRILREAAEAGLVHSTANQCGQIYYICNCCTCCCGVLRGVVEFGIPTAVARSDFRAAVREDACTSCSSCVEQCHFGALSVSDDVCAVDHSRCVGCGLCVAACPGEAIFLERRPEGEVPKPPVSTREWLAQRARERGVSLSDIL